MIVATDLLMRTRLEDLARAAELVPEVRTMLPLSEERPAVLVVDLDAPAGLDGVAAWRERWPDLRIVGFVSHVDEETSRAARALGCVVFPRGASARKDPRLLVDEGR